MQPKLPELRDFAAHYTPGWCSQSPERVAAFFSPDGSLRVNDDPAAVGRNYPGRAVVRDSISRSIGDDGCLLLRGGVVEYHWTLVGTNTGLGGTGRRVRISGSETWWFGSDGLIVSSQGRFDVPEYHRQLQEGI